MKPVEVACYNCNSKKYNYYDSENGFNLVKCDSCGLLFVNPRPSLEDISAALATGVHSGETIMDFTGIYEKPKIAKYLRILNDFYPKENCDLSVAKWLDIGCGYGELLEALKIYTSNKIKAKGSDPNEAKARFAKTQNLDVSFIDLETHTEKYDIISLLNVFSHIPDPVRFFANLKKNLKPHGEIFLQTGHTCHLPVKHHHKPYQMPDHLSFANREIIENIFRKLGFEIVNVKIYRNEFFPYTFNLKKFIKETAKFILRRRKSIWGIIPRYPYQDMFVRCRLISSN